MSLIDFVQHLSSGRVQNLNSDAEITDVSLADGAAITTTIAAMDLTKRVAVSRFNRSSKLQRCSHYVATLNFLLSYT